MSWYHDKVNEIISEKLPEPSAANLPSKKLYEAYGKDMSVTITFLDMNTPADQEKITNALLGLEGVSRVKPALQQKKVSVVFNIKKVSVETIVYTINQLGYHHIQRG